jgi:hypothetical protein
VAARGKASKKISASRRKPALIPENSFMGVITMLIAGMGFMVSS